MERVRNMTTFLSIALLLVGTTATLAAFGGKTWKEGTEPALERITPRGWVSLLCLVLALALGVISQLHDSNESSKKEQRAKDAASQAKGEADKRQAILEAELLDSQRRLDLANQKLKDLGTIASLTEERLKDTRNQLTGGDSYVYFELTSALGPVLIDGFLPNQISSLTTELS